MLTERRYRRQRTNSLAWGPFLLQHLAYNT